MDSGLLGLLRIEPVTFFLVAGSLILALSLHEFAHAFVADLQGDRMPRAMGRLTINPARHLDPLGTLCLLLVGFGWAKPVEFRLTALRSKRFGAALVALAGPLMNLLLALIAAFALVPLLPEQLLGLSIGELSVPAQFFFHFMFYNLLLAVFNLMPLPPLDGSRLLTIFLPPRHQRIVFFLDRYGFLILLALVFFGGVTIFQPILEWALDLLLDVAGR